jgi:DNA invertase Pin-like site-specific DNA recombinase
MPIRPDIALAGPGKIDRRLIGYARVSTYGQTLESQLKQLRAAGCSGRNIYREKVTGARPDRRELRRMLKAACPRRRGDGDAHRPPGAQHP